MAITLEELITQLGDDSSIADFLTTSEKTTCCTNAAKETGWPFPVSGDLQELWIEQRAKRNCYFMLWTQSARKFKVEQLNLNQRFDHYGKVIEKMDAEFEKLKEDRPELFMNVDSYKAFGTVAGPGFVYDITGKDITDLV